MAPSVSLLTFSNELLREVLDHIEQDPQKLVNLDRRAYLSVESFNLRPLPSQSQAQDIGSFRLTCKRFSELGAIHQFAKVTTRFSTAGFQRLEKIASQQHLAKHVRKFTYMVPYFYVEGRERVRDLPLPNLPELGQFTKKHFARKVEEQRTLVGTQEDSRVLGKAISAFTSLQHVQILRLQDRHDGALLHYIRQNENLASLVELRWAPACSHSTKTIGLALLRSKHSPCSRFSFPMLSPQSLLVLADHLPRHIGEQIGRLKSLELHFDEGSDLDNRMMQLSGFFRTLFTAAENMQAIHLGFPTHRPLNIPFEAIFHNVKWSKLSAFGIQSWRLESREIIAFASRHRDKLRGLRLRDVLLKDDNMWKDVLSFLRTDMANLDWVSLRRINYARYVDEAAGGGVELPDDLQGGVSDSDDEMGGADDEAVDYEMNNIGTASDAGTQEDEEEEDSGGEDDDEGDGDGDGDGDAHTNDVDHNADSHRVDLPQMDPDAPPSQPWCNCNAADIGSPDDLGDDGISVSGTQRRAWEQWVVRRCPEHRMRTSMNGHG